MSTQPPPIDFGIVSSPDSNSFTDQQHEKYPILLALELLAPDVNLESKISDIKDGMDVLYVMMRCEELYEIAIDNRESELCNQLRIIDIHDLIQFWKGGILTKEIKKWIDFNLDELILIKRPIYKSYLRNDKIDDILNFYI